MLDLEKKFWDEVFGEYKRVYLNVLCRFYPSMGSTGFQERNLSVNFSKAYETIARKEIARNGKKKSETAFSWFEFQFCKKEQENENKKGQKNDNHFDCLLVNTFRKEIVFVESKRFLNEGRKESIKKDIERITDYVNGEMTTDSRFNGYRDYRVYGLILTDVWQNEEERKDKKKKEFYRSFKERTAFGEGKYSVLDVPERGKKIEGVEKEEYALLSFLWTVEPNR